MQLERTKNTIKGTFWGMVNKIITLLVPFFVRTVFIYTLGIQYLGLSSLFGSILQVLSLAELGLSSAIIYSLYKPIAENDTETISALMNYYRHIYRIIGIVIGSAGLCVLPFLKFLIKADLPEDINVYILYLIYLVNTSLSYFLFAYKSALLNAFQRIDLISKINMVITLIAYAFQVLILVTLKNYYAYVILVPFFTIVSNITTATIVDKNYPDYKPKGKLPTEVHNSIKEKLKGLIIQKIGQTSRNSLDSIIISSLIGLTAVGIYNNYYMILFAVVGFLQTFCSSIQAGIGNSIASASVEKNYNDFKRLHFIYMWVVIMCVTCLFCMYQPFMTLWMGEKNLLSFIDVALLSLYLFSLAQGDMNAAYYSGAGLYEYGKFRYLMEAALNLILNIILGKLFGVTGIILATILTIYLFTYWYGSFLVYKYYFKNGRYKYFLLRNFEYLLIAVATCSVSYFICRYFVLFPTIINLILCAIVAVIVPNILNYLVFRWTPTFKETKKWLLEKKNSLKQN